jgi:hypothetical protein
VADEAARLFIALYTDADVHGALAAQIRRRGFDTISAYEAGNAGLDDDDQLEYAVSQRRAILTCNARHFEPLFEEWWQTGRKHYGVVVAEQLPVGKLLRRVLRLLNTVSAEEMENGYRDLAEFADLRE